MKIKGSVIKYGDNVDTDVIIPARYLNLSDEKELAFHCMEDIDTDFRDKVKTRKIIVAGNNFGCGSSREHAPLAIKVSGVKLIIAKDFARIFYRNAINIGLPILECSEAVNDTFDGDELEIDFDTGFIYNSTKDKSYKTFPFPDFLQNIINASGLMNTVKKEDTYEL
ncbi:MAG TPA: 3-isopropylmalate dehydratase small subunit [Clostridia bacterium]|nr:3-isopropylmalate dehydratase small subunit [Clostridia bacterium]